MSKPPQPDGAPGRSGLSGGLQALAERRLLWLVPLVVVLLVVAGLLVALSRSGPLSPFLYPVL